MNNYINYIAKNNPDAIAMLRGSDNFPDLRSIVKLYQTQNGVLVVTEAANLPEIPDNKHKIFAMHIHSGSKCTGTAIDPFADASTHYNPTDKAHPYHAGDLPPLFSSNGYAFGVFLTKRFYVRDVINKAIIIHANPDDFTTQPSGNSGEKIACGIIRYYYGNAVFRI